MLLHYAYTSGHCCHHLLSRLGVAINSIILTTVTFTRGVTHRYPLCPRVDVVTITRGRLKRFVNNAISCHARSSLTSLIGPINGSNVTPTLHSTTSRFKVNPCSVPHLHIFSIADYSAAGRQSTASSRSGHSMHHSIAAFYIGFGIDECWLMLEWRSSFDIRVNTHPSYLYWIIVGGWRELSVLICHQQSAYLTQWSIIILWNSLPILYAS